MYTGKICSHEFHINLTWNSHEKFHVRFTSIELIHETHVKMFMWISRELRFTWIWCEIFHMNFTWNLQQQKMIFFMNLIKFENLKVIWNTLFWKFMWISHEIFLRDFHMSFTWDSRETHKNWFHMSFTYKLVWGEIDVNFTWDSHEFKFTWNWCEWNLPV